MKMTKMATCSPEIFGQLGNLRQWLVLEEL
jgi:hypothetical protein